MEQSRPKKYRYHCLTWHGFEEYTGDITTDDLFKKLNATYMVYQIEECPETKKLHMQAYCEFANPRSVSGIQKVMPGVHSEKRKGTSSEAADYCKKNDTRYENLGPYEFGVRSSNEQGKRSDLEDLKDAINSGKSVEELFDEHFAPMIKYPKGIGQFITLKARRRDFQTHWELHLGEPGTGKTTSVASRYPGAYWKAANEWWCDYNGEPVVVLDEFYGYLPFTTLLRLGDSTPLSVQVKGASRQFLASTVIFISNSHPLAWYKDARLDTRALIRRFGKVYFHQKHAEPEVFDSIDEMEARHGRKDHY